MAIEEDWVIDLENKRIVHKSGTNIYSVGELYSWIMEVFGSPEFMKYLIPMEARSKTLFVLVDGWKISNVDRKFLKNGNIIEKNTKSLNIKKMN